MVYFPWLTRVGNAFKMFSHVKFTPIRMILTHYVNLNIFHAYAVGSSPVSYGGDAQPANIITTAINTAMENVNLVI
jgi:hypothetical protein